MVGERKRERGQMKKREDKKEGGKTKRKEKRKTKTGDERYREGNEK